MKPTCLGMQQPQQQRCMLSQQPHARLGRPRLPLRGARSVASQRLVAQASGKETDLTPELAGGPPGSNGAGGRGGGGDGSGGNGSSGAAGGGAALLAGKALETLPADMAEALSAGKLPQEMLQRFLDMDKNPILAWLLRIGPFRERLLADPSFMVKVAIECGIGICTKCTAEYNKRGDNFNKASTAGAPSVTQNGRAVLQQRRAVRPERGELDFVFANVLMAIIADFMLVWLPAPAFSLSGPKAPTNPFAKVFAGCPENAFQKVPPGYAPFSLGQRAGAVVRNGLKLTAVGMFASLVGVGVTNVLMGVRALLDPAFTPLNPPQDVLIMSAAYGTYMASSSNLRYQIVAGLIEERGIEVLFRGNPGLCHALSFVIRTANTYLGSLLWVDYIRLLGLQKAPVH
ncbi:hypothetical protein N2152v2_001978 [Parachlorella kessleri]